MPAAPVLPEPDRQLPGYECLGIYGPSSSANPPSLIKMKNANANATSLIKMKNANANANSLIKMKNANANSLIKMKKMKNTNPTS